MEKFVQLHRKIAPELLPVIEDRYNILRCVLYTQPVGRRALAGILGMGERVVRAQVEQLKYTGLIEFSPLGMTVTTEGQSVMTDLSEYIHSLHGLTELEEEIADVLGFQRVVVIPGDCETDETVKRELGRAAAQILEQYLCPQSVLALSGGSTMALMAEAIQATMPSVTVVPSRGGLGEKVEYQASTIASVAARKLGGNYRMLHIPDGLSDEAMETLLAADPNMKAVADMVKQADILFHGIGEAAEMARRRGMLGEWIEQLVADGAVGEALGHYFTIQGDVLYTTNSVGLHLEDLDGIGKIIGVAAGRGKAKAIIAVARAIGRDVLVTDEAAARHMLDIF